MKKQYEDNKKAFWDKEDNLINLNILQTKETRKYFKCKKPDYI